MHIASTKSLWGTFQVFILLFANLTAAYTPLSESFLRAIPSGGDDLDPVTGRLLAPILVPRVPGSESHAGVQQHFVNYFRNELRDWTIEWQNSTSTTPLSSGAEVAFRNLIFKREPPWVREGQANLLTLVAHYDSKVSPDGFIGATDSAAPCAILLHVARSLDQYMTQMHDKMSALGEGGTTETDMGVQILLLDGEEAFVTWSATDSTYGSRALAKAWGENSHPPLSYYRNPLGQINLFVLLDLLGSANPAVRSYFPTTHWAYNSMASVESRMRTLELLESKPASPFLPESERMTGTAGMISDDHLPFLAQSVPILHLIPYPFPAVWHKETDDGAHLDMSTVRDWSKILTAFALEFLDAMKVWTEPGRIKGRNL